ncbi:hypothetical protein [Limobrevibacterium gyesilva]|uniref:Uncharacterized protein n=1 Tax=Limobrevibacterium gyesilva TaxID=2991712 RepID=A0AA42CFF9_9PROT|nr:hypothetical protein [Limobrevibacterium gyesilva]MCW3477138.1 hypothetical protein [Limobrevibacterium gyesilva]
MDDTEALRLEIADLRAAMGANRLMLQAMMVAMGFTDDEIAEFGRVAMVNAGSADVSRLLSNSSDPALVKQEIGRFIASFRESPA